MSFSSSDTHVPAVDEPYMNPSQLDYFRQRLLSRRQQLIDIDQCCKDALRQNDKGLGDEADQASKVTEMTMTVGNRVRTARELHAIDQALKRIAQGDFGYCTISGEEIGLARLNADPTAPLCIVEQERRERGFYHAA